MTQHSAQPLQESDDGHGRSRAKNLRRGLRRGRHLVVLVVVFALCVGTAGSLNACSSEGSEATAPGAAPLTTAVPTTQSTGIASGNTVVTPGGTVGGADSPAVAVAQRLGPSVVNITVSGTREVQMPGFFGGRQQYSGEGSGVIYRADGMILTNNHVVTDEYGDPVDKIEVTLTTGETLPASIVGRDPLTDLAVIKVEFAQELPAALFLNEQPTVGEYAIAIGSPLGYENSVTLGIVSGLNRSIEGVGGTEGVALNNLIQTDAPISPGNSGGALGNVRAQVIGINVAYLPPAQTGAVNIGFAIPSVVATQVADQIIQSGKVTHAYLGVGTQTVTSDLAEQFGLSRTSGALVAQVTANGPADKAGIKRGDIIFELDGKAVKNSSDLLVAIRDKKPGEKVQVKLDRNGTELSVTVTLEERPENLQ